MTSLNIQLNHQYSSKIVDRNNKRELSKIYYQNDYSAMNKKKKSLYEGVDVPQRGI